MIMESSKLGALEERSGPRSLPSLLNTLPVVITGLSSLTLLARLIRHTLIFSILFVKHLSAKICLHLVYLNLVEVNSLNQIGFY